jgi:hypothetical protein
MVQQSFINPEEHFFLEYVYPESTEQLLAMLSHRSRETIFKIYSDVEEFFVMREIHKAFIYYDINPDKRPRNRRHWTTAIMRWLENAYIKARFKSSSEVKT